MNIKTIFTTLCLMLCFAVVSIAQSPVGTWKTIDDVTGEAKSYVEITERNGKFYGKVVKLLRVAEDTVCDACSGDKKDKPLMGMEILWDLEPYKSYWSYGQIVDPESGKVYKCSLYVEDEDTLRLRGYIGFSALGRNQNWYRVK